MLSKDLFKEKIGMFNIVVSKQLDVVGQQIYFKKLSHLDNQIFNDVMDDLFNSMEKYWSVPSIFEILKEYTKIVAKNNSIFNKIMIDSIKLREKPKYKKIIEEALVFSGGWNQLKLLMSIEDNENKIEVMRNKFYEYLIKNHEDNTNKILTHHNQLLLNG